jgi:hypothetical protein
LENITENLATSRAGTITSIGLSDRLVDFAVASEAIDKLITEGGEGFFNYVDRIGLANDPNLIVLSSLHNYYYDSEEMNNVTTVINLKELNLIKQIKSSLHYQLQSLPEKCNFVGCFVNNEKVERFALRNGTSSSEKIRKYDDIELGIVSQFPFINMIYSLMDLKTNLFMSVRSVTLMLRVDGFKVIDMTELNGLTFFCAQKVKETFN